VHLPEATRDALVSPADVERFASELPGRLTPDERTARARQMAIEAIRLVLLFRPVAEAAAREGGA
jgi:hypothetical protein